MCHGYSIIIFVIFIIGNEIIFYINLCYHILLGLTSEVEYDQNLMNVLTTLGFPREAVKRALFFTSNQNLELAIKWLMDNITNYDYAEPFIPQRSNLNNGKYIHLEFCHYLIINKG